jgi:hypothetical protein
MPSLEARLARIAGRFVDAEDIAAVVRIGCQHSFLANRWREAIARISPFVGLPAALLALEMAPTYLLPEAEVQTEELPSPEKKPSQHEYAIRLREIRARISALKERLILAVGPERAEVKGEISDQIEVGMGFAERLFRVVHAQAEKTWTDDPALIEGGFEPFIMPDRMPLVVEFVSGRSKAFKFVRATRNAGGVPVGEASLDYAISLADAVL